MRSVRQIWRTDRMGRGGGQVPFLQKGYPAIRFSVGVEDYDHQHQDLRTEDGVFYGDTVEEMDFAYLAGVTKLNVRALDAIARAPMPPKVTVDAAVRAARTSAADAGCDHPVAPVRCSAHRRGRCDDRPQRFRARDCVRIARPAGG